MVDYSRKAVSVGEAMILVAGGSVGTWLVTLDPLVFDLDGVVSWKSGLIIYFAILAGMSMFGVMLLLRWRLRSRRPWRTGALCWFTIGLGSWAFAPMIVIDHYFAGSPVDISIAAIYFALVLPIQTLLVLIGCVIGRGLARDWHRCHCWWPEWFGMWISLCWAILGLIELGMHYIGQLF